MWSFIILGHFYILQQRADKNWLTNPLSLQHALLARSQHFLICLHLPGVQCEKGTFVSAKVDVFWSTVVAEGNIMFKHAIALKDVWVGTNRPDARKHSLPMLPQRRPDACWLKNSILNWAPFCLIILYWFGLPMLQCQCPIVPLCVFKGLQDTPS